LPDHGNGGGARIMSDPDLFPSGVRNERRSMPTARKAVVLVSGGLDSTTALAMAQSEGFDPYALGFRYGQRHVVELECARRVADALRVRDHVVVEFDLRQFGGSALTGHRRPQGSIDVPDVRNHTGDVRACPPTALPATDAMRAFCGRKASPRLERETCFSSNMRGHKAASDLCVRLEPLKSRQAAAYCESDDGKSSCGTA
jgi:hypothetical protein